MLAVTTVMAYPGAYALPEGNLYDLKQRMLFRIVVEISMCDAPHTG
jgi:hypothetical protein